MLVSKVTFLLLLVTWSVLGGHEPETRVVGGKDAPEGLVPHQASLRSNDNWNFCGAAVISDRWLLTAAHCVKNLTPKDFFIVVGTLYRTKGGTSYAVSKVIPHKDHNKPNRFNNDIAVVSTKNTIAFNKNVQPLPLPEKDTPGGMLCILSGWGKLGYGKGPPDTLKYLYVKTLASTDCDKYYKDHDPTIIKPSQICTLNKAGEGTCQGDSGGSLVCNGTSAGIVSFSWACAWNYPDVYANTYMYKSWIAENTRSP